MSRKAITPKSLYPKNRKRTKAVQELVDYTNQYLVCVGRDYANNDTFWHIMNYLSHKRMYEGYNIYKKKLNEKGDIVYVNARLEEFEFVQFY